MRDPIESLSLSLFVLRPSLFPVVDVILENNAPAAVYEPHESPRRSFGEIGNRMSPSVYREVSVLKNSEFEVTYIQTCKYVQIRKNANTKGEREQIGQESYRKEKSLKTEAGRT